MAGPSTLPPVSINISLTDTVSFTVMRPAAEEVNKSIKIAKEIFVEAFSTNYSSYHQKSGSKESVEAWLKLKEGYTINKWLEDTFEDEYNKFLKGKRVFLFLVSANQELVGWMTYKPVTENGDIYLSQCCLKAQWRQKRVATTAFHRVIQGQELMSLFPGLKTAKLIARRINEAAAHLYTKAGFTVCEQIDPSQFGKGYDGRYVGYLLPLA